MTGVDIFISVIAISSLFLFFVFAARTFTNRRNQANWMLMLHFGRQMERFGKRYYSDNIPEEVKHSEEWKKMEAFFNSMGYIWKNIDTFSNEKWQDMVDKSIAYNNRITDLINHSWWERKENYHREMEADFNYAIGKSHNNQ